MRVVDLRTRNHLQRARNQKGNHRERELIGQPAHCCQATQTHLDDGLVLE
jgi:hypothetical protein